VGDAEERDVSLRFAAPLLLALGVPLVLLVAFRLRSLPRDHHGARRRVIQIVMLLASICAALAIARLEWGTRQDRLAVVFAIDRSRSVERSSDDGAEAAITQAREAEATMRDGDEAGVVVFAAEAATEVVPQERPELTRSHASIARDATDIGAAIRRALADLPGDYTGRIVLVSDGVETDGDALAAAQIAAGRGITIDVLPVERAPSPEVAIDRVQVPETADPGQPVEVRIVTRATQAASVRVRVLRDGVAIAEADTTVDQGADVLTLRDVAAGAGMHRYDVVLEPTDAASDGTPENNEGGAFMRVTGASHVLVLSDHVDQAEALVAAIRAVGFEVDLRGRAGAPTQLSELASYDLVVLSDLHARALSEDQMTAFRAFVHDLGGGLLMLGTRDSFGLGGYAYTPIEEALPATFDLRRRRDRASLAMVIAIDRSGSMSMPVRPGVTKLDVANEAAGQSAMLLSANDRVGVEHVDTAPSWTLPMTSVTDPAAVAAAIHRAQPGGGGIFVDTALIAGYDALRREETQLKHLLLFSDGSDSEEMTQSRTLVAAALRDGITTSIVSMGRGVNTPELEALSRLGGGRFYIVEDMTQLPRIFTEETIAASRSAIVEEAIHPQLGTASQITEHIDFATAPALNGFVVTNARPRASVLLVARGEDPLLTTWQYGVGRSAAFTCDGGGALARPWLAWSGYGTLFGQLARALARSPERRDADVSVTIQGGRGHVRVEAVDPQTGHYRNYLDLSATIAAPGGASSDVALTQTGPGRYEADFDAAAPGAYIATVREMDEGGDGALIASSGVVRTRGDELRGDGTDHALLAQIAAATDGHVLTSLARVFVDRPAPTYSYRGLWRELLLAAMLLLLGSVALRRLIMPREIVEAAMRLVPASVRARFGRRGRTAAPVGATSLDALTASARERRAARAPAPEVVAARSAEGEAAPRTQAAESPWTGTPEPTKPTEAKPDAPRSLAENLVARRKKKK
jgi:uncharacterized membrane protein